MRDATTLQELKRNRWVRRAAWALGGLLAFWALAWLAVPPLLRSQGEKLASEQLGRKVTIGRVEFSPWTLELTVHDIAVAAADGGAAQLAIKRLYLDAELQSLLRLAPVVDAVEVDEPRVRLTHLGGGHYDIDDVIARLAPPPTQPTQPVGEPQRFALYNLSVNGGQFDFTDRSVNRTQEVRDLKLSIPFLSNLASQRTVKTVPHLSFALNGSRFDSTAQSTPFAQTRKTDATFSLRQFDLQPLLVYLPASLPVRVQGAVLSADLTLAFEQTPEPQVRLSGTVQAEKIQVSTPTGSQLLAVQRVDLSLRDLQPLARKVDIARLEISAPQLTASRAANGQLNLLSGLTSTAKAAKPANPADPVKAPEARKPPEAEPLAWQVQLAELVVRQGGASWTDEAVAPHARLALSQLDLTASQITLPFGQPATFKGTALLDKTTLSFAGLGTDRAATATLSLNGLPLPLAAPYVAQYLEPRLAGALDAELALQWTAAGPLQLSAPRLELHQLALSQGKATLAAVRNLKLTGVKADLGARTLHAEALAVTQPSGRIERDAKGQWMFERWSKAPPSTPPGTGTTPWAASLGALTVAGGPISFVDRLPPKPVALEISAIQLRAGQLVLNGARPSPVNLSLTLRSGQTEAGTLALKGEVTAVPLSAQLAVDAVRLPVHAFEPYFADALNVELLRADTSFKGQLRYASAPAGPTLRVQGDASVQDLRANSVAGTAAAADTAQGEELLTCQSLSLRGLDLALAPGAAPRVSLRETVLSDFYARVVLRETGRLNLLDIVKSTANGSVTATSTATASPAVTATASNAPAPVISLGPMSVVNGKVQFSDRFIKPNYSASLTELAGRLGGFASTTPGGTAQLADLELRGKAEGTASLEIKGKLNPLAKPLVLDITGVVRNLELSPLSPYSVKYAGHGIQRGKLSVDVRYQVQPDSHLQATNKLVLHQLAFGDEVKGAPNSLPVKLAVALLADRNGVIDIDMPISGSLNDPQFSLAPVIFKAIVNLILKAITAPFSLLAGALGGSADELSTVPFAAGSAVLTDAARQSLDKVAKALTDRPALNMTVVGTSRLDAERDAVKRERLQQLLVAEKRRATVVAGATVTTATTAVTVTAAEAPALLKEVYRRTDIPAKPRNALGFAKDLPTPEMQALLLASMSVTEEQMRELALARGVAVRDYLAGKGVPVERLFLGAIKTTGDGGKTTQAWSPRAELNLATR